MRDAEDFRARARELYDMAKRARYADDGLRYVLRAMQFESDADELAGMQARATEHVHTGDPAAELVASA